MIVSPKLSYFLSGFAVAAALSCILPAAVSVSMGAPSTKVAPAFQINRTLKGDRQAAPRATVAKRKLPVEAPRELPLTPELKDAQKILDGCEPLFSPVTVPSMAHLAGRCIG
jgi:hypothetical protein